MAVFKGHLEKEQNYLIVSSLVELDQKFQGPNFTGIHDIEKHLLSGLDGQIFAVKFGSHGTPDFGTLNTSQKALVLQLHPVGFVQFGANEEVQVLNFVIFAHESGGQAEFAVSIDDGQDAAEHFGGNGVHFVQDHQTPFLALQPLHDLLRLPGALLRVSNHVVSGDADAGVTSGLVLGVGGEATQHGIVRGRPHFELRPPLLHRDAGIAEDQAALAHSAAGRNAHQSLPRTAGEDNDAGPGTTIPEHLPQTLFLVRPMSGRWFQVKINVRIVLIVTKIIFSQKGILQFDAAFLENFNHVLLHFKGNNLKLQKKIRTWILGHGKKSWNTQ
jgi:hypothetical protein